jgi:hypothetical protein
MFKLGCDKHRNKINNTTKLGSMLKLGMIRNETTEIMW